MKNSIKLFIIITAAFFFACEKTDSDKVEIMPISEGNTWIYHYTNHSYNEIDTFKLIIGPETELNGHKGYLVGTSDLIRSDESGNTIQVGTFSENDTVITESLLYKCNIEEGESYDLLMVVSSSSSIYLEERTVIMTCSKKDTLISTPIGNFNCIVLEHSPDNGGNIFKDYMCKNIGKVKSERFEDGKLFSSSLLIEYSLN